MKFGEVVRFAAVWCLMLPVLAKAQLTYSTNSNGIVITGYIGTNDNVIIPDTINGLPVIEIGVAAFSGQATLANVVIANSVTNIDEAAFAWCSSLTNVVIGNNVTTIGPVAFRDCYGLTTINIPDSVVDLTQQTFEFCVGLTNVTIGKGVQILGSQVFASCINLPNVTIPTNVTIIGDSAFGSCYKLATVAIPNSVTSIGSGAFLSTSLADVSIPSSVTNLGVSPFYNCPVLKTITVNPNNPLFCSEGGILFNASQTVILQVPPANPSANYVIPSTVAAVWHDAFSSCAYLTEVTVPDTVTNIGDRAFQSCLALTNVTIGTNVRIIGNDAFNNCVGLSSVTVPDSVRSVGDGAFFHCVSLTNAIIGSGVTNLGRVNTDGYGTFARCSNSLTAIYFRGNAPIANALVFQFDTDSVVYYLPGTTGWSSTFGGRPTTAWLPDIRSSEVQSGRNGFDFDIRWADGQKVVVEACSKLSNPVWQPVWTNTVTGGGIHFDDPQFSSAPGRFYRVRSP